MRLIDADALKRTIKHRCVLSALDAPRPLVYGNTDINDLINELPIIELKHGRWIVNNETKEWVTIWCNQCHDGMWNRKDEPYPNYCFSCGARMDEAEE